MTTLTTRTQALALATELGAPAHLVRHLELVSEVAAQLAQALRQAGVALDTALVEVGAALHDAGKIVHPGELHGPGEEHETAGERLLLERGVDPRVARCCRSHGRALELAASLEEMLVGLADNLWRGQRQPALELAIVDRAASLLGQDRWDLFPALDACFEALAADGDVRLARSAGD
ncbi:MAG: HD domain-containing protein [Pseudomonadota bacterium]